MQNYALIKRFALIVERLSDRYPPSLKDIAERLSQEGFVVSGRTIQRDMERLRDDFGLEIVYAPKTNTYGINEQEDRFDALLRLIRSINTSELLMQSLKERDKTLSRISFQNSVRQETGTRWLEPVFRAICEGCCISFEHENFAKNRFSTHTVKPLMLKEYSDNWYLVATLRTSGIIRIFGLDRIEKLTVEDDRFDVRGCPPVADMFQHVIGLVHDLEQPAVVRLSVNAEQARHFKSTPLHHSQTVEEENAEATIFAYYLTPNRELRRLILSYGAQVKVLAPEWFARQMEEEIGKMLEKYRK